MVYARDSGQRIQLSWAGNVLEEIIRGFSTIAAPIMERLKKKKIQMGRKTRGEFDFTEEEVIYCPCVSLAKL